MFKSQIIWQIRALFTGRKFPDMTVEGGDDDDDDDDEGNRISLL